MAIRLYFDLEAFQAQISEDSVLNIDYFKIWESSSKDGQYVAICTVDYNPRLDYISVPAYTAATSVAAVVPGYSSEFSWFKLSYLAGYANATLVEAEVVPCTDLVFAVSLATYPIQAGSVVLKDAGATMATASVMYSEGDQGNGVFVAQNIAAAVIDYTSGSISGTLVTTPSGAITADYYHFLEWHKESDLSDALLGDNVSAIITHVRMALNDTDIYNPAFTDEEYLIKIKEAIRRFKGIEGKVLILESEISVIILLVRISCCYSLAYDHARVYRLELPDDVKLFRGEITEHYLAIAKGLENHYKQLLDDWGGSGDEGQLTGTPVMEVVQCTKQSYFKTSRVNKYGY